eukprot:1195222-Prorocentrum_minimum.AAC.2
MQAVEYAFTRSGTTTCDRLKRSETREGRAASSPSLVAVSRSSRESQSQSLRVSEPQSLRVSESQSQSLRASESQSLRVTESQSQSLRASEPQSLRVSESQSLRVSESQSLRVSESQSLRVSESQSLRVTESQSHRVSESQSHRVSESQSLRVSESQSLRSLRVSESQSLRVSESQSLKVSESQSLRVSESQSLRVSESQSHRVTESRVALPRPALRCRCRYLEGLPGRDNGVAASVPQVHRLPQQVDHLHRRSCVRLPPSRARGHLRRGGRKLSTRAHTHPNSRASSVQGTAHAFPNSSESRHGWPRTAAAGSPFPPSASGPGPAVISFASATALSRSLVSTSRTSSSARSCTRSPDGRRRPRTPGVGWLAARRLNLNVSTTGSHACMRALYVSSSSSIPSLWDPPVRFRACHVRGENIPIRGTSYERRENFCAPPTPTLTPTPTPDSTGLSRRTLATVCMWAIRIIPYSDLRPVLNPKGALSRRVRCTSQVVSSSPDAEPPRAGGVLGLLRVRHRHPHVPHRQLQHRHLPRPAVPVPGLRVVQQHQPDVAHRRAQKRRRLPLLRLLLLPGEGAARFAAGVVGQRLVRRAQHPPVDVRRPLAVAAGVERLELRVRVEHLHRPPGGFQRLNLARTTSARTHHAASRAGRSKLLLTRCPKATPPPRATRGGRAGATPAAPSRRGPTPPPPCPASPAWASRSPRAGGSRAAPARARRTAASRASPTWASSTSAANQRRYSSMALDSSLRWRRSVRQVTAGSVLNTHPLEVHRGDHPQRARRARILQNLMSPDSPRELPGGAVRGGQLEDDGGGHPVDAGDGRVQLAVGHEDAQVQAGGGVLAHRPHADVGHEAPRFRRGQSNFDASRKMSEQVGQYVGKK